MSERLSIARHLTGFTARQAKLDKGCAIFGLTFEGSESLGERVWVANADLVHSLHLLRHLFERSLAERHDIVAQSRTRCGVLSQRACTAGRITADNITYLPPSHVLIRGAISVETSRRRNRRRFNMSAVSLQFLFCEAIEGGPGDNGGFSPVTTITVLVQNLAYTKLVGIWGLANTGTWSLTPCSYNSSVPGNLEIWQCGFGTVPPAQFDVEYQVLGNIYWDNNAGYNYSA